MDYIKSVQYKFSYKHIRMFITKFIKKVFVLEQLIVYLKKYPSILMLSNQYRWIFFMFIFFSIKKFLFLYIHKTCLLVNFQ